MSTPLQKSRLEGLEFEINPKYLNEGLTQSEMQCWDNCAEKWYLGYNLMLQLRGKFSWALTYGGWMHSALEEFYATKGKRWSWNPDLKDQGKWLRQQQLADAEYWQALGKIQMEIYASYYKQDFKLYKILATEEKLDLEFEGVRLKGMLDVWSWSEAHKGFYVWDHKTTGRLDKQVVTGWDFRLQFMFYCWCASKLWPKQPVHGFIINAIKKPQLRRGVNEPLSEFLQRVQSHMMQEPLKYFYRERLRLKREDLVHFESHILRPKLQRVRMLLNPKVSDEVKFALLRNKNTDHCLHYGQPCEFMPICRNGIKIEGAAYRVRKHKHEELIEEIA